MTDEPDDPDFNARLNPLLPDAQWPLQPTPSLPPPLDYNTPWPELVDSPNKTNGPAAGGPSCSHANPYVMRSKKYGSAHPTNNDAPLSVDQANPDTWDRDDPPREESKPIVTADGGNPVNVEVTGHGFSTGDTVFIEGTDTVPSIDGIWPITVVDADDFTIPMVGPITDVGTGIGTAAKTTSGVTIGPEQRHYKYGSGSGTFSEIVFAREKTWDSCGELVSIGEEVIIQTATIAGSGSASGGLP